MKWTAEDDARLIPFIEEADRDEVLLTEEEFWARVAEDEAEERRERQLKRKQKIKNIKLHIMKPLEKISKKFVKI